MNFPVKKGDTVVEFVDRVPVPRVVARVGDGYLWLYGTKVFRRVFIKVQIDFDVLTEWEVDRG